MAKENRGVAILGQVISVLLPVGVIVAAAWVILQWLNGPLNALKSLFEKQYDDYLKELKQYTSDTNGGLTPDQKEALARKENAMNNTLGGILQLRADTTLLMGIIVIIVGAVLYSFFKNNPGLVTKFHRPNNRTDPRSAYCCAYEGVCVLCEDLSAAGNWTQSVALKTTMFDYFSTVEAVSMQQQIDYMTQHLNEMVGWQYLYYMYMINALTLDLVTIPALFALLPPPPV